MPPRKSRSANKATSPPPPVAADDSLLASAAHTLSDAASTLSTAVSSFASAELPTAAQVGHQIEGVVEGLHVGHEVGEDEGAREDVKGKGKGKAVEPRVEEDEEDSSSKSARKPTIEERQAKLKELRMKMNASTAANRKDLIAEHQRQKTTAKELAHLEKKKRLAETLREQADAEDNGEDMERNKNWAYSIEDSDNWDKKLEARKEFVNEGFVDAAHSAHRNFNKVTMLNKPDLAMYNYQKEQALGLEPGTLTSQGSTSKAVQRMKPMDEASLYSDTNNMEFMNHKPSEEAVDAVVGQLNKEFTSRMNSSRKRANEDEGDVTYINDANKVFNKKINRYYDRYTKEIRANFERGTAL